MANIEIYDAVPVSDGAGVNMLRAIGTPHLQRLDPFLLLDHFSTDQPDDYLAGFPNHPHRGFITLTYMLEGRMLHEDSMENRGELGPGAVQWMKAASGVIHSEMPQQLEGAMRGFQLWINLPASEKMTRPEYQEFPADGIPMWRESGVEVRVIAGRVGTQTGPVVDPITALTYLDVRLSAGQQYAPQAVQGDQCFIFVYEGSVGLADSVVRSPQVADITLDVAGNAFPPMTAGEDGVKYLFIAGTAINEPVVQHGPFVMNTVEEIQLAIAEYQSGQLVK